MAATRRRRRTGGVQNNDVAIQSANGALAYWRLQETSGASPQAWNRAKAGVAASSQFPGSELLSTAGDGTSDKDNYGALNSAVLTNPSVGILRIARNGVNNPLATQIVLTAGGRFKWKMQARSDGNAIPRVFVDNAGAVGWTGTNSTDWQDVDFEHVDTATLFALSSNTAVDTEYTEWRYISVRQSNILNGTHTGVGVGVAGNGRGIRYVARYGAARYTQLDATTLDTIMDFATFSIGGWARVEQASDWTDTNVRAALNIGADASNNIQVGSDGAGNFQVVIDSGGNTRTLPAAMTGRLDLFNWMLTNNAAQAQLFINGVLVDTDATALVAWAGPVVDSLCVLGASNDTPANELARDLAYPAIYDDIPSQSQITNIYNAGA